MKMQPDFTKLFYSYFGNTPKKVTYEIRQGPNRYYDLIFLSSLIHDARFSHINIRFNRKRLTIPINRDCWELGFIEKEKSSELHIADAILTISPVVSIQWKFNHESDFTPKTELWIQDIWIDRQSIQDDDSMTIIINGFTWKCFLTVIDDNLKIKLRDLGVPHLFKK